MKEHIIRPIAYLRGDLKEKFGIPRQAGLVEELESAIEFEPEYRDAQALRGMEGFSHLWLIWQFSENLRESWSPTVRPPRLGGNERMGVFATRSPFRPNALGLSCVKLIKVEREGENAPRLIVAGADLMDGTPIFDIKPYVPYADAHPEALSGFAAGAPEELEVVFAPGTAEKVPADKLPALRHILANDPRPRYHKDAQRVYTMDFAELSVSFRVEDGRVTVEEIKKQA